MAGLNTTGLPQTKDYTLGRGIVYLSNVDATTGKPKGGWRDVGNVPSFTVTGETDTLEHISSRAGLAVTDKEVTTKKVNSIKFEFDELNFQNLSLYFAGSTATHTNVAVAGFTVFVMVPDGELALGTWYDVVNASGNRAYDITATDLTITTNEGVPVAMVLNTDYTVDTKQGRIFIKATSTVAATAIGLSKGLKVILAAKPGAKAVTELRSLTGADAIVFVKFIGENPADSNKQVEWQFHQVTLKGSGDVGLIGDDWIKCGLEGKCEANTLFDSTSPYFRVRSVAD